MQGHTHIEYSGPVSCGVSLAASTKCSSCSNQASQPASVLPKFPLHYLFPFFSLFSSDFFLVLLLPLDIFVPHGHLCFSFMAGTFIEFCDHILKHVHTVN